MSRNAARLKITVASVLLVIGGLAQANLIIGGPAPGENSFPFGGKGAVGLGANSHYQQVYDDAAFGGPINIGEIDFFLSSPGNTGIGTFTLSLSHSRNTVDHLDTSDFANNIGSDNALFAVLVLTGDAAPATLKIVGNNFNYDGVGDLLLDIQVSGFQRTANSAFFLSNNGNAGGRFSRAHDFGVANTGTGLITGFKTTVNGHAPEPGALALVGIAMAGLALMRRRVAV